MYASAREAADELGLENGSSITQYCKRAKHFNQAGGYF
jgi:hypothetical protein